MEVAGTPFVFRIVHRMEMGYNGTKHFFRYVL